MVSGARWILRLGVQAVVKPDWWTCPSTHSVWPEVLREQPAAYSGATVSGSAVVEGMMAGVVDLGEAAAVAEVGLVGFDLGGEEGVAETVAEFGEAAAAVGFEGGAVGWA